MKKLILMFVLWLPVINAFAYTGNGGTSAHPPTPTRGPAPPPGLPIDNYLIFLFFVGILIYYMLHKEPLKSSNSK